MVPVGELYEGDAFFYQGDTWFVIGQNMQITTACNSTDDDLQISPSTLVEVL